MSWIVVTTTNWGSKVIAYGPYRSKDKAREAAERLTRRYSSVPCPRGRLVDCLIYEETRIFVAQELSKEEK